MRTTLRSATARILLAVAVIAVLLLVLGAVLSSWSSTSGGVSPVQRIAVGSPAATPPQ